MDQEQRLGKPELALHETFCRYLAQQLIAKHGFEEGSPHAAADLAAQSDYMLTYHDGYSIVVIGLIDRDAHPGKAFTLPLARVQAIADACRELAGRVGFARMPVGLELMEVGGASADQ